MMRSIPSTGNPNCLQTTSALLVRRLQLLSQTVPQVLLWHISTRPLVALPPRSLISSPAVHGI